MSENNLSKQQKIRRLAESAVMVALATILAELTVIKFPFGGSVTVCSQVPVILLSYRYGVKWGAKAGLAMAALQIVFGLENFSYVSGIVPWLILLLSDYLIAFTALGFGGMFRNRVKNQTLSLLLGASVVTAVRFVCHFISGVTIWQSYAAPMPVWKYSLTYNGGYMLPEWLITLVGCAVISLLFDLKTQELRLNQRKSAE